MNKFWVGNTGKWNDPQHWSSTSGGSGGSSAPSGSDNVYFDENSFTLTGRTITIDGDAYCNNLSFAGVANKPTLAGHRKLETYGNITFETPANMNVSYDGLIKMHNGGTFNGNGQSFDVVRMMGTNIYSIVGDNTIQSLIAEAGGTLKLKAGSNQNIGQLKAIGIASNHVSIVSDAEGSFATITSNSYRIFSKYCNIQDIHTAGSAEFQAIRSVNNGNNDGWEFVEGVVISTTDSITTSETNGYLSVAGSDVKVYEHPESHPATMIETDATHQFVTNAEKATWNSGGGVDLSNYYTKTQDDTLLADKVDKVTGKGLSTEDYTTAEKNKLFALNSANYEPADANIQSHIGSTSNPHSVTKSQVGLENVSNDTQLKVSSNLSDVADVDTSKTNLGLGTQDSPQFKAVKVDVNYTVQSNNNTLEVVFN
jgi:hypothetical protein